MSLILKGTNTSRRPALSHHLVIQIKPWPLVHGLASRRPLLDFQENFRKCLIWGKQKPHRTSRHQYRKTGQKYKALTTKVTIGNISPEAQFRVLLLEGFPLKSVSPQQVSNVADVETPSQREMGTPCMGRPLVPSMSCLSHLCHPGIT